MQTKLAHSRSQLAAYLEMDSEAWLCEDSMGLYGLMHHWLESGDSDACLSLSGSSTRQEHVVLQMSGAARRSYRA
jgi:hypothetical protein